MALNCIIMINTIKILIVLSGLLFSLNSNAKNLAIIIGNEAYQNVGKLDNPVRDAKLVASKFEAIGYETRLSKNLDEFNFNKLVKSIARESSNYDVTVIYYAGHAVQLGGLNYMLAVDQLPPKTEEDIKLSAVLMDDLIQSIKSPLAVVLMDSCRDNPLIQQTLAASTRGLLSRGLAPPPTKSGGLFVAYATASGTTATDGISETNSPFAKALANNISRPESIDDMFSRVTKEVLQNTNNEQRPFKYASLEDKFCLPGPCEELVANYIPPPSPKNKITIEKKVTNKNSYTDDIIKIYPKLLPFYEDWVSFEYNDKLIYQFSPLTYQYNTKTNIATFEEKVIKQTSGLASIFSVDGTFSINSTNINCSTKKIMHDKITDYDQEGNVVTSFTIPKNKQSWFDVVPGSIGESAYNNFCGTNAIAVNLIPGTTKSNAKFISSDKGGHYYWGDSGKVSYKDESFYGVLFEYKKITKDEKLNINITGEIVVATASCQDRTQATQIRTLFLNEKKKIYGMGFKDNKISLLPNSAGRILLDSDCDGQAISTASTETLQKNNTQDTTYNVPNDMGKDSLAKMATDSALKMCQSVSDKVSLPMTVDSVTTWDALGCFNIDNKVNGVYRYTVAGGRVTADSIKGQWSKQKNTWCTNPDQHAALKQMNVEFYYSDTSGKFIGKNAFTINDCD